MWAYAITAPGRLERVEAPEPVLRPGRLLVELGAGGICGSDLPSFHGVRGVFVDAYGAPGFPLHECVGRVVDGPLPAGTRVVGWAEGHHGLAERYVARLDATTTVSDAFTDEEATVIQPLATVLHQLDRIERVEGRRAAVVGLGSIGLLFTHALKARGAHVTGVDRVDRTAIKDAFGIDEAIHGDAAALDPDAFDIVVEAVGHHAGPLEAAVRALADHGTLLAFGVPDDSHYAFPFKAFFRKHGTLIAGAATDRASALARAHAHLEAHKALLEPYITDVFAIDRAQEAFECASTPRAGRHKVVLTNGDAEPRGQQRPELDQLQ
jgi:threonine dehydrogenase-like Zn-dependent dehydrogenase